MLRLNQFIRKYKLGEVHHPNVVKMPSIEPIEKLRQLGLTEYEAQAYLVLVKGSQMTAEEVARKAKIPIPRVYGVLDSLKKLGLIVILKGRPKKYEIVDPDEGLQNLIDLRRQVAEESIRQLGEVCVEVKDQLSPVFWRRRLRIRPEDLLESLENLAIAEKKTKELISEATSTLDIFTDIFSWFDGIESELKKAVNRGIKIRVIMDMQHSTTKKTVGKLQSLGIEVRQTPDLKFPVRGTLTDGSKVVFLIWASPEGGREEPRYVYRPSFSANEGIVSIFQHSFEYRWIQAKPRKSTK
jgi:sugar-specific transcriptional regulator TrmB